MAPLLFRNFQLLEPDFGEVRAGYELLVEGETIRELSDSPIRSDSAEVIDCGGRTLMPGLIDSHVHVFLSEVVIRSMESMPLTLMTARAIGLMKGMIDRGFTTVRDTGGADWGIKEAVEKGHVSAPRLFIAGQAIGPTGGHSDPRRRTDFGSRCNCCNAMAYTMNVSDGVSSVRKSVREQMRLGADHIKIMMSGGVASPYDPLDSLQFSLDEVRTAVEEAAADRFGQRRADRRLAGTADPHHHHRGRRGQTLPVLWPVHGPVFGGGHGSATGSPEPGRRAAAWR